MSNKGFSLVELMVTVAILGVIAAIAIPSYNSYIQDTYVAQASADLKACGMALERYYSNDFSYELADDNNVCLTTSPTDATGDQVQYNLEYVNLSSTGYTIRMVPRGGSCGTGDCLVLNQLGNQTVE